MFSILSPLLRPLARLMIQRNIRFQDFAEAMKLEFVQAARASGQKTDSAISIATGLQRREVARLKSAEIAEPTAPNPLSRLVAKWLTDYEGAPLSRAEFDQLAQSIRTDVHPKSQLDALVANGTAAVMEDDGRVTLWASSYTPPGGSNDQLDYLAQNTGDHLATALHNLSSDTRMFEQAVHYNHLSATAIEELRTVYNSEQMALLERINAHAAILQDEDNPENHRFRAGGYFFTEEEET